MAISNRNFNMQSWQGLGKAGWFIVGALAGGAVAMIFDPVSGHRRRALIRDKGVRLRNGTRWYSNKEARNLTNRAKGAVAEATQALHSEGPVDDETLVSRVRSEFGRVVTHPRSIHVHAADGVVTLRGPILTEEVDDLIECVESVRGVKSVKNELEAHRTAENVPGLQGEGKGSRGVLQ